MEGPKNQIYIRLPKSHKQSLTFHLLRLALLYQSAASSVAQEQSLLLHCVLAGSHCCTPSGLFFETFQKSEMTRKQGKNCQQILKLLKLSRLSTTTIRSSKTPQFKSSTFCQSKKMQNVLKVKSGYLKGVNRTPL